MARKPRHGTARSIVSTTDFCYRLKNTRFTQTEDNTLAESMMKISGLAELTRNQEAFEKHRETLEREHMGKFALFSNGELIEVIEDEDQAYKKGYATYGYGEFTLHGIGEEPVSCGSARPYSLDELKADGLV